MSNPIENWVNALKLGNLLKTTHCLKRSGELPSYSAIGVLCEHYRFAHPTKARWMGDEFNYRHNGSGGGLFTTILLPDIVAKWAGLPSTNPILNWSFKYSALRPEDDCNSAQALKDADKFKDSGDSDIKRIYDSAKKRRDNWESYRGHTASGEDSLLNIQNIIGMSFAQIAQILTKTYL